MNKLYYGDCLTIMKEMGKDSVDLIYLDPPFNSNRTYNAIYKDETGRPLPDQIEAFCDLWSLDAERERAIRNLPKVLLENGYDERDVKFWRVWMDALRYSNPKLLAYLSYMTERLLQMRIILRPTGSIYLHCDPTASHYIKVIMDGIFGQENFRNEIVWCYPPGGAGPKYGFHRKHDILLFYSKLEEANTFNRPYTKLTDDAKKKFNKTDEEGRRYKEYPGGRTYLDESRGRPVSCWWTDIHSLGQTQSNERLGYPTQKPLKLLQRIINASSNPGDIVFDPFCGCGTTLHAAEIEGRKWIGIDIAIHAIKRVSAVRLKEKCGLIEGKDYEISGIPRNIEGAQDLWKRDTYQFQKWAVEMVDGFVTAQKAGDGGVDGRLYFPVGEELKAMKLEVKGGGTVRFESLRALAGVIDEQDYPMGGFITLKTLGNIQKQNFLDFCRTKGTVEISGTHYPRLQILSVSELFDGESFDTPLVRGRSSTDQMGLFDMTT